MGPAPTHAIFIQTIPRLCTKSSHASTGSSEVVLTMGRCTLLLGLLPLYAEAGFKMKGYDSGEPGSGPCESHTLSWADSQWTNLENPHTSDADVACLDFYEFDAPVSMLIDASACGSSPAATITLATYDSHGCGADLDQSFDFIDGQCLTQETDPWVCFFINSAGGVSGGHCWNIFSVRLECYDPLAPIEEDADDDSPDSAGGGPVAMILVGVAILLVGVAGGIFVSRRKPVADAPAAIQMATHVVVEDRVAKADPEAPPEPSGLPVASAQEVPAPVWA